MLIFLCLPKIENIIDRENDHISYNSKDHEKCKFTLKVLRYLTVSNLFTLEVIQKCQCCQLCVSRENSIVRSKL